MPKSEYPTDDDITSYLTNIGAVLPPGFSAEGYAALAYQEWERRTGYTPFLGDTVDKTRIFDPPGPNNFSTYYWRLGGGGLILNMGAGLWQITSLTVGVANEEPGTPYTKGLDFFLDPMNAPVQNQPWEFVRFVVRQFGPQESVQIVGRFGWGQEIPDDAWEAIRRIGVSLALQDVAEGMSTDALNWRDIDQQESISPQQLEGIGSRALKYAERVLRGYTRAGL